MLRLALAFWAFPMYLQCLSYCILAFVWFCVRLQYLVGVLAFIRVEALNSRKIQRRCFLSACLHTVSDSFLWLINLCVTSNQGAVGALVLFMLICVCPCPSDSQLGLWGMFVIEYEVQVPGFFEYLSLSLCFIAFFRIWSLGVSI